MRVFGTLVNMQLGDDRTAETIVRDHSLDGAFDDQFGMATATGLGRFGFMATNETGVAHVLFLDFLLAGKDSFFGIDHDNVIAGVDVSGEDSLVFSTQQYSGFFRNTTDNLVVRVDDVPLTINSFGLGTKSFHREPKIKPRRPRCVKDFRGYFWL